MASIGYDCVSTREQNPDGQTDLFSAAGCGKLIGYARVSTRHQSTARRVVDLASPGVRRDDLYVDHDVSGLAPSRPEFEARPA